MRGLVGDGGKLIRVNTLRREGPGSLLEAIDTKGLRIVVFEVGGIIDLNVKSIKITEKVRIPWAPWSTAERTAS